MYCSRYNKDEGCASVFSENSDEVIGRGCISDLETSQRDSCERNSTNCLKCSYNKCNQDDSKLKTEFCIECDSEYNPDCLKENLLLEKRCPTNQCFTRFIEKEDKYYGRHIERGCLADLLETRQCIAPDCVSCAGKNCNNKLFPENRISCKSCQMETCNGGAVDKICNQYVEDEACLTFFGEENKAIFRECYADAPIGTRQLCDDESNINCKKCKGNLCNNDNIRLGNKCYKCEGLECFNPGLSYEVNCLSECFVGINENGEPWRDCAKAVENSTSCGVTDLTCLKCGDDYCNSVLYPTQGRLTCIKCLNNDCEASNTIVNEYCERLHIDERCVTVFDDSGSVVERGCSSSIQNSASCIENSNCLSCDFDKCNVETSAAEKYHCVSCNSNNDTKCVSNPMETQAVSCRTNQCYSRLLDVNGTGQHIARGCLTDLPECSGSACMTCTGERCNSQSFPADRHSCYYCSGDHCALGHLHEKQCTIYNQQDKSCTTVYGTGE